MCDTAFYAISCVLTSSYTLGMCVSVSSIVISHSTPFFLTVPLSSVNVLSDLRWRAFCNDSQTKYDNNIINLSSAETFTPAC